jgi:diguanylate cyclase (GGDEF)-like protein
MAAMCGFFAAAVYVTSLVNERQTMLKNVSRYNICWVASQAVAEFTRLEATLAEFAIPGSQVDADEVQLRLDILKNRLALLSDGEFKAFASQDPENAAVSGELAEALGAVQPLVRRLDRPSTIAKALAALSPLGPKLAQLAASANRFGGERVAEDQQQLIRLHWTFSGIVGGLFASGLGLLIFLGWHNKLLARAQVRLSLLAQELRQASNHLERANDEVKAINTELQARNHVLQQRESEIGTQNKRFDAALNNMSQALCMVDAAERLVVYNQRFADLFQLHFTPLPGMPFAEFIDLSACAHLRDMYGRQRVSSKDGGSVAFIQDLSDGRTISVSHQAMPDGGWVATYEDISQRRQAEARIVLLAHYDGLTGLVNRAFFHQQLAPALTRADGQARQLAVLCLDLDGFKDVNDTYGHPTGDQLLCEVGKRLKADCREDDIVARLGGDEFAILHILDEEPEKVGELAARLIDRLGEPFDLDGRNIQITASIGIALAPRDGRSAEEVMKNADLALYRAKSEGKRGHRFFEQDMEAERRERRSLENDLRAALVNGDLRVHFQPLVDSRRVQITGFEALTRWSHPVRGPVSPAVFIPVAEEIGIISALGEWVLREACRQAATWPGELTVAINLSPAQFKTGNLIETLQDILATSGLAPHRLELEITESLLLDKCDSTMQTLHAMRALGIRIAMDDFGTGYSSLSYLRSFPFDKIKIDQSFVRELTSHPDCIKIVRSIAALGASLGMTTTAEGVETAEQFEQLQRAGCDQVQGYYFGRPQAIHQLRYTLPRSFNPRAQAAPEADSLLSSAGLLH